MAGQQLGKVWKVLIRRFFRRSRRRTGWDLRPFDPLTSQWAQLVRQLTFQQVNVVFDVGANVGQFAQNLRDSGFEGRIVSFEASSLAYSVLCDRAKPDSNWIIAPRAAIGDRDGKTTMNISRNGVSSSVLPILASHVNVDPKSRYVSSEDADLCTLDTIGAQFVPCGDRIFLKVDVQGFEYQVLQGATSVLRNVIGWQMELSLVPLYSGGHLFESMTRLASQYGFELWSLEPVFVDKQTGRLLQVDGVFFRSGGEQPSPCDNGVFSGRSDMRG